MVGTRRAAAAGRRHARAARRAWRAPLALCLGGLLAGCAGAAGPAADAPAAPPAAETRTPSAREDARDAEADRTPGTEPQAAGSTEGPAPRVGSLVEDFPVDLLPVPEDAVLLVTSAVPVGGSAVREVSLNLRTRLTVEDAMALYRDVLTEAGFAEVSSPTDESGPTADATFTRSGGDELVTIGVVDVDGARTLTLGGRVRTDEA
jgi:hypothetical protein